MVEGREWFENEDENEKRDEEFYNIINTGNAFGKNL